jgi:hypothetical protein
MVLKGRGFDGFDAFNNQAFNNQNLIFRSRTFGVTIGGALSVELRGQSHNWSTDGRVFLVTKNSRIARLGQFHLTGNGTDTLQIVPFGLNNAVWDPEFLGALEKKGDELYIALLPVAEDLEAKLMIGLPFKSDWGSDLFVANPQPQDGAPVDLPALVVDTAGNIDPGALLEWFDAANELAPAQHGFSFGEVAESLPDGFAVSRIHFEPRTIRYEQAVYPRIDGARVVGRSGAFMIDVEAEANTRARGVFYRRIQAGADPVESVEGIAWVDFIREEVADVNQSRRLVLSVIAHDLATVVVDNMEVDSIKRVCKKGKKLYRIVLQPAREGGGLNSRVNAGMYERCSLWVHAYLE